MIKIIQIPLDKGDRKTSIADKKGPTRHMADTSYSGGNKPKGKDWELRLKNPTRTDEHDVELESYNTDMDYQPTTGIPDIQPNPAIGDAPIEDLYLEDDTKKALEKDNVKSNINNERISQYRADSRIFRKSKKEK